MLKRIFQISVLAFIAWLLSPVLNIIFPLPTESMVEGLIDFSNPKDVTIFQFMRYIVWVIILALIFKFAKPFLSFVLPVSRRYGTTKPLRRFQGYFGFLIFLIFVAILASSIVFNSYKDEVFEPIVEEEIQQFEDSLDAIYSTDAIRDRMEENRKEAKKIALKYLTEWELEYYDVWPHKGKAFIDMYSTLIPKGLISYRQPFPQGYPVKDGLVYRDSEYRRLYREQWELHREKENLEQGILDFLNTNGITLENGKQWERKNGEIRAWQRFNNSSLKFFIHVLKKYKHLLAVSLIITYVVLGLAMAFISKSSIGKFYDKVLSVFQQGRFGLGGSARFAGLFEEWALDFNGLNEALFMGQSLYYSDLFIGLKDPRHMMTIAGTRAGKGATAIIPNLILWHGSALVIDPKGTNAAVTMQRRKNGLKQDVHIIDPFKIVDMPDDKRASFNPLEFLDINSPAIREHINIIAEALVVPDKNQKEKHWDDGAKTVIAGLIAHIVSSGKYEAPALHMIRDLISCMPEEQDVLWAEMSLNDKAGRLAKDAANRIIRGINTNEISSIISNADKHTEWLSSPSMAKTLGSSSFHFGDMKEKPTTIYLVLPPEYLETHNRFLRLFVNLAINQMSIGGKAKVPVLLMLDEFLALGRMEEVEKAFGLMAGYNLILWPFIQDLGRLKELYGNSVNAFIANSRAVQVFGVNDHETKEFVSKTIGERRLDKSIMGANHSIDVSVKLRDETEVGLDIAADSGRQYILRSGKSPLILEKVSYYNNELFMGKYTPDPDYKK